MTMMAEWRLFFVEKRIVVVGDVGLDSFVFGSVDRLNPEAPIPLLNRQRSVKGLAMAGLVANMVKALGAVPRLVCLGGHIRAFMANAGLDTDYVVPWNGRMITKTRYMASAAGRPHQPILRVDDEVIEPIDRETAHLVVERFQEALDGAAAVVVSDYGKGLLDDWLTQNIVSRAAKIGVPVLVDPARDCGSWRKYSGTTVIKANRHEAAAAGFTWQASQAYTTDSLPRVRRAHSDDFSEWVVVTLDGEGCLLVNRDSEIHYAATAVHMVADVVGAGDQFIAAMAVAIANGADVASSCRLGNIAAAIQVGRSGCVPVSRGDLSEACRSCGSFELLDFLGRDEPPAALRFGAADDLPYRRTGGVEIDGDVGPD